MWIFSGDKIKLNVELLSYLDYHDLIQQKKTESQSPAWRRLVWLLGI